MVRPRAKKIVPAGTKMLRLTQTRSYIGYSENQRRILKGLGLWRLGGSVLLQDTPSIRGMQAKIPQNSFHGIGCQAQ